jgi:hypothetical protein
MRKLGVLILLLAITMTVATMAAGWNWGGKGHPTAGWTWDGSATTN